MKNNTEPEECALSDSRVVQRFPTLDFVVAHEALSQGGACPGSETHHVVDGLPDRGRSIPFPPPRHRLAMLLRTTASSDARACRFATCDGHETRIPSVRVPG